MAVLLSYRVDTQRRERLGRVTRFTKSKPLLRRQRLNEPIQGVLERVITGDFLAGGMAHPPYSLRVLSKGADGAGDGVLVRRDQQTLYAVGNQLRLCGDVAADDRKARRHRLQTGPRLVLPVAGQDH